MTRRPPRSTLSSSSAASDVYKRQVSRRVRGFEASRMACAVIHLRGEGEEISGLIQITQESPDAPILIKGQVSGLDPGKHGLHVREFGDFTDGPGSARGIFNPDCKTHGSPEDADRMAGDLGNIEADADGKAVIDISDAVATLFGDRSILARSLVIHENEDDLGTGAEEDEESSTKLDGNVGEGVAWGVIGLSTGF
eukprot:TRINITY_DN18205_c0_g1_i2.p1 TRINITY_DN18205_c0_g1~~TRINITY_DN18205_c0_g1_i2.p1  ORF type:complete len:196 (-),score=54.40 TRINITY_DN18205_c0_g1_i2:183-770(-)